MDLLARSNYGINDDITPLFGNLVNDSLSSSGTDFSLWIEKQLLAPDKSEDSALKLTTSALLLRPGTYGEDFNASSSNSTTIVDSCQATWSKLFEPDWAESSDFSLPPKYNVFFWQIFCICWGCPICFPLLLKFADGVEVLSLRGPVYRVHCSSQLCLMQTVLQ